MSSNQLVISEEETQLMWAFAESLLRFPHDPFQAAKTVTYGDTVKALLILQKWGDSVEINRMKAALVKEHGEEAYLPSQAAMVSEVIQRAQRTKDDGDFVKLMSLAFDVRGMTSKSQKGTSVVVNNNTQVNNKTMRIPVMVDNLGNELDDKEWEKALTSQQDMLVNKNVR